MDQAESLRNVIRKRDQRLLPNAEVITVTSGKGGVGKSNVAVNLAVQFRKSGKRVIIFDADFGLANVEVMFGTIPQYNLSDMIYGGRDIRDIITPGPMEIGFISGGSGIVSLNNLREDQIDELIRRLSLLNSLCDVLIIDTGAGIADNVMKFVAASPEVLLVSTPEPSSITDSYSLLKALYRDPAFRKDGTNIHLVVNKVSDRAEADTVYAKLSSVVGKFLDGELDYLGLIPMDASLEKAVRAQKVVSLEYPRSRSAEAFEAIAAELSGDGKKADYRWGIMKMLRDFFAGMHAE